MTTDLKQQVAKEALKRLPRDEIIGMGTGSTVDCLIDLMAPHAADFKGMVASSERTAERLRALQIPLHALNDVGPLAFYVDGADEATPHGDLIKGGGGALTREKILAEASSVFLCMIDERKWVKRLGAFPLPVEVIPMARSLVARKLMGMGGQPTYRENVLTDNGNVILDVRGLDLTDPVRMEHDINQLPGVVTVGLFARRKPDGILIARSDRVEWVPIQSAVDRPLNP